MMPDPKVRIPPIDVFTISLISSCEFDPIPVQTPLVEKAMQILTPIQTKDNGIIEYDVYDYDAIIKEIHITGILNPLRNLNFLQRTLNMAAKNDHYLPRVVISNFLKVLQPVESTNRGFVSEQAFRKAAANQAFKSLIIGNLPTEIAHFYEAKLIEAQQGQAFSFAERLHSAMLDDIPNYYTIAEFELVETAFYNLSNQIKFVGTPFTLADIENNNRMSLAPIKHLLLPEQVGTDWTDYEITFFGAYYNLIQPGALLDFISYLYHNNHLAMVSQHCIELLISYFKVADTQ